MQRAGRTGRTNDGTVWQLVAPSSYHSFNDFEVASMQLQLMRKEVLLLTCATSKVLTDARSVLQGCLDPPESKAVEQAEQYLLPREGRSANASYVLPSCGPFCFSFWASLDPHASPLPVPLLLEKDRRVPPPAASSAESSLAQHLTRTKQQLGVLEQEGFRFKGLTSRNHPNAQSSGSSLSTRVNCATDLTQERSS